MNFMPQAIPDVLVIELEFHKDERGYFTETFREDKLSEAVGRNINFVQENESKSTKGVLRGLHFQSPPFAQSKLVRVIDGAVLDVAIDIRKGSPNYGQYVSVELSSINKKQVFIPRGFAHGFLVLSESVTFSYKVDNYYSANHEHGLAYNDHEINIDWQVEKEQLVLSKRDVQQPKLKELNEFFLYDQNYYE